MNLLDLFSGSGQSSDDTAGLRTLRAWAIAGVELARAESRDSGGSELLNRHVDSLSAQQVTDLTLTLTPAVANEIASRIEDVRRLRASTDAKRAGEIQTRLSSVVRRLDGVNRRHRLWSWSLSALKVGAYVGPAILAYLVATYFRFNDSVYWQSEAVTAPVAAYAGMEGRYALDSQYKQRFYREFSKFYFSRPSSLFERIWTDASESKGPLLKLRMVFRNPRGAEQQLISTVGATATFHAVRFDWSSVDVSADVEVTAESDRVWLRDTGIGPAVDLHYTMSGGGLTLRHFNRKVFHNETTSIDVDDVDDDEIIVIATARRDPGVLHDPIFMKQPSDGDAAAPRSGASGERAQSARSNEVVCDGEVYERVTSVARLAELTTVVHGGTATVDVSFESLRGDASSKQATVALPKSLVFARRTPDLSEVDPCAPPPPPPAPPVAAAPPPPPAPSFIDKLLGPEVKLTGVDLIKTAVTIELTHLQDGDVTAAVASPDQILNPGGFLIVDVTAEKPSNGQLTLALAVNGTDVRRVEIAALVPDQMKFSRDLAAERRRFKPTRDVTEVTSGGSSTR
jgi:hypothetical protein